ncbi:SDR family oxidoreductase [Bradyrhizobium sp. USDA 4011]
MVASHTRSRQCGCARLHRNRDQRRGPHRPRALPADRRPHRVQALGQPEDVAGAVVFLSMPASRYATGTVIAVDGGFLAG